MIYKSITSVNKIIRIFKIILFSKKTILPPKNKSILIFDINGSEIIGDLILGHKEFNILPTRYETINIFVLCLSIFKMKKYKTYTYFNTYIYLTKPKYILTYIDTSSRLLMIKKNFKQIKYIFFQNGNKQKRWLNMFKEKHNLDTNLDYYFTHQEDLTRFSKKIFTGNIITAGSIINNSFKKNEIFQKIKKIQWISQYRQTLNDNNEIGNNYEYHLLKPIINFCDNNNFELEILCSTKNNQKEINFYSKISKNFNFIANKDFSSYKALSNNSIIIGIDSVLLKESFARGFRTGFLSVRADKKININQSIAFDNSFDFGWPYIYEDDNTFWSSRFSEDKVTNILNFLNNVSLADWKRLQSKYSSFMTHNYDNRIIKDKLLKLSSDLIK